MKRWRTLVELEVEAEESDAANLRRTLPVLLEPLGLRVVSTTTAEAWMVEDLRKPVPPVRTAGVGMPPVRLGRRMGAGPSG